MHPESEGDVLEKRRVKQLVDELDAICKVEGIQRQERVITEKKPAGSKGEPIELQTNVFGVKLPALSMYRYDVRITAQFEGRTKNIELEFTKKAKADHVAAHRKDRCREVFRLLSEEYAEFFGQPRHAVFYDCQALMYSVKRIPALELKNPLKIKMRFDQRGDVPELLEGVQKVTIKLTKVPGKLPLDDLSFINAETMERDTALQQFLQLLINQHVMFSPEDHISFTAGLSYLTDPKKYGFTEKDCPRLEGGKCLKVGCERSVHFVEGPEGDGNACAAMVLDMKKTAFHEASSLIEKVASIIHNFDAARKVNNSDVAKLNSALKGLFVRSTHTANPRTFAIHGVVESTADEQQFCQGGGEYSTISRYFKTRYDIALKYPHLPLITVYEKNSTCYYPIEVLSVCANQRVPFSQQTSAQLAKTIRACAVPPIDRAIHTKTNLKSLELKHNKFLENARVKVASKPMMLKARVINPPEVLYADRERVQLENGSWRTARGRGAFIKPSIVRGWAVFLLAGSSHVIGERDLRAFINGFRRECQSKGVSVPEPDLVEHLRPEAAQVDSAMEKCSKRDIPFVLFITDDNIKDLHKSVKLMELKWKIVTQDLRLSTVMCVTTKNKWQTLDNIVAKTNVKLGGINYEVSVSNEKKLTRLKAGSLVIGFAVSYSNIRSPGPTAKQSAVVGYAANIKAHPDDYIGDYFFEDSVNSEKITSVMGIVEDCVRRFRDSRGHYPTGVIVYRNGTSEGQYGYVQEYEIPMIERAIENAGATQAPLSFVIPQKMHNVRLMPRHLNYNDRVVEQNIKSGTVLDHGIVDPLYTEYYMNSHAGLAGSSKTPRYTVLYDRNGLSMDELQMLTHSLCYGFQIIKQAISLPTPVMVAARYADRGRALLDAADDSWLDEKTTDRVDYADLGKKLSYRGTELENFRVNA